MSLWDPKEELAGIAASLRAYLEQQVATGATGIPRAPKRAAAGREAEPRVAIEPLPPPPVPPPPQRPPAKAAPVELHAFPEPVVAPRPEAAAPVARAATPAVAVPTDPAERKARLDLVEQTVRSCTKCPLAPTRKNTVFSRGNPAAALCFVGEAPGADEDEEGLPFVGRAGQLLDKMITAMGLDPAKDVYVCNIIKCRPPENRRPTPEESAACLPYLQEQLALVQPKVMVALGNTAVGTLLNTKLGITKLRGQWKLYGGTTMLMPTYHPSYLLRPSAQQAQAKREAWEDLQAVMKELGLALPAKA